MDIFNRENVDSIAVGRCELDSKLLQVNTYRAVVVNVSTRELISLLRLLRSKKGRLLYLYSGCDIDCHGIANFGYKIHFYGKNQYFKRDLEGIAIEIVSCVEEYANNMDLASLEELAVACCERSHLSIDPAISAEVVHEIYLRWLHSAIERRSLLVASHLGHLKGLLAYDIQGRSARITLLSVQKSERKNNISTMLIGHLISLINDTGAAEEVLIATSMNSPAKNLYEKLGFVSYATYNIYHVWM